MVALFACRCLRPFLYISRFKAARVTPPQEFCAALAHRKAATTGPNYGGKSPMATVEDKVKECIVSQLGVNDDEVTPEASFVDDLGADSLDIVELVMALEDKFGIEIPDEDVEKMRTVKDAIDYVNSKSAE